MTVVGLLAFHDLGHRNTVTPSTPLYIPSAARNLKSITARPDAQSHACIVTENQTFSVSALRCNRHFRFFDFRCAALRMTVVGYARSYDPATASLSFQAPP